MVKGKGLPIGQIVMVVVIAILAIYLFNEFMPKTKDYACRATDIDNPDTEKDEQRHGCTAVGMIVKIREFVIPENLQQQGGPLFFMLKLIIVGLAVTLAYGVVMKTIGQPMSRRHILTLIVIGIAVIFLWTYIVNPIWQADSIDTIVWKAGQKLGLL